MGQKVAVIGGAGYIGSHISQYLRENGFEVVIFDNFSTGHRESVKDLTFFEGNLLNVVDLDRFFAEHKVEAVLHFAAFSLVGESVENPAKYYYNNVVGTFQLLEAMRRAGVGRLVFSSTAAVYGEPELVPISEDAVQKPTNPYGQTKLAVENMLRDFQKAYSLEYVSLRYFNACGAAYELGEWHEPESHLIPLVLMTALGQREKCFINGNDYPTKDGTRVRDYIHVLDLASAHLLALKHLLAGGGSRVYNLGSGEGYSIREVIETCKEVTGIDFPVEERERRAGDPATLIASSGKIHSELGWSVTKTLKDIVSDAWLWHQKLAERKK